MKRLICLSVCYAKFDDDAPLCPDKSLRLLSRKNILETFTIYILPGDQVTIFY